MRSGFPVIICSVFLSGCTREEPVRTTATDPTPAPRPEFQLEQGLPPEIELEELRLVVRTLADENRRLREQVQSTGVQTPPTQRPTPQSPAPPPSDSPADLPASTPTPQVLYVNPQWDYLVIDQGEDYGLNKNQTVHIFREGLLIAKANITDSKAGQAVAEIDLESLGSSGYYPRETDEVRLP